MSISYLINSFLNLEDFNRYLPRDLFFNILMKLSFPQQCLIGIYDLAKIIGYFSNQAVHKSSLMHSNKCYSSDIRNLKSQIEKLKKDRKEPFLTEDQIKCFG